MSRKKNKKGRAAVLLEDVLSRAPSWAAAGAAALWTGFTLYKYVDKGVRFEPMAWTAFLDLLLALPSTLAGGLARDILLCAGLWLLFERIGRSVADRLGLAGVSTTERRFIAAGLGAGAASTALLLSGLARLWRPWLLQALFYGGLAAVFGLAVYRRWRPAEEDEPRGTAVFLKKTEMGPFEWAAAALIVCTLVMNLLAAAVPEIFYDSLVYHLALPNLYLQRGAIVPTPENLFSGMPLGLQMLFGWCLAIANEGLAAVLHLSFGLGAAAVLWVWGRRHGSPRTGLLAALLFYLSPVTIYASWHCGVDLASSFYVLLALFAAARSFSSEEDAGPWSICAGLLTGFAMSTKYNVFVVGAALILVRAGLAHRQGLPFRHSLQMGIAAFCVLSPWLLKNLFFYGNPLYPFLHNVIGWTRPELWQDFLGAVGARPLGWALGTAEGIKTLILFPWRASFGNWPLGDWPGPAFIMLVPWALLRRWGVLRRSEEPAPAWTAAVLMAAAGYLSWTLSSRLVRYLVPALPFIALSVAFAVERGPFPRWLRRIGWAVAIFAAVYNFQAAFRQSDVIGQWTYLRRGRDKFDYLTHQRTTYGLPYYSAAAFMNKELPRDAKVLFLGESRSYYLDRDHIAATVFDTNPFWTAAKEAKDAAELAARVRAMGVTHIHLSARQMVYRAESSAILPRKTASGGVFGEFFARHLKLLFEDREDGGSDPRWLTVYEILDDPLTDRSKFTENPVHIVLSYFRFTDKEKN